VAIAFKPSTLFNFHRGLVQRKYRLLFSPKQKTKPGPKGPTADLIRAVVEMKQRNPTWGCPHIAEQINLAFATAIPKELRFQKRDQSWKLVGARTLWLCGPGTAMRAP
jgi:putative transposase